MRILANCLDRRANTDNHLDRNVKRILSVGIQQSRREQIMSRTPRKNSNGHLEPAANIIRRLGGPIAVAKVTNVNITAPYRWQAPRDRGGTGGIIPYKHHAALLRHARKLGVKIRPVQFLPS